MLLVCATLSEFASGVVAAHNRQTALVSNASCYRKVEKVAREQAVGALSTKDMPKKQKALESGTSSAQHVQEFRSLMRKTLTEGVASGLASLASADLW